MNYPKFTSYPLDEIDEIDSNLLEDEIKAKLFTQILDVVSFPRQ